jgi:hypothetical protein
MDTRIDLIHCHPCNAPTIAHRVSGATIWPHRPDLAETPVAQCYKCKNYVSVDTYSLDPTGPIGDAHIRELRKEAFNTARRINPLNYVRLLNSALRYLKQKRLTYIHTDQQLKTFKGTLEHLNNTDAHFGFLDYVPDTYWGD